MVCPNCHKRIPRKSIYCMYCGIGVSQGAQTDVSTQIRRCILCGRELPEESISDVCLSCLYGRDFSSDTPHAQELLLPTDEPVNVQPKSSARHYRRWGIRLLIAAIAAVLLFLLLSRVIPQFSSPQSASSSASQLSSDEKLAAEYAQAMVKAAAYDPSSLHYSTRSLEVSEENGTYIVTQEFTRSVPEGDSVTEPYEAGLILNEDGYTPLYLQVGDELLYDYRS